MLKQNATGIYKILVGQYSYIGYTADSFRNRWEWHLADLRAAKHSNFRLQTLYENGEELNFSILERISKYSDKSLFKQREIFHMFLSQDISNTLNSSCDLRKSLKIVQQTNIIPLDSQIAVQTWFESAKNDLAAEERNAMRDSRINRKMKLTRGN